MDTVEIQDQEIIEQVNKSMRSKVYDRGRYSPTREQEFIIFTMISTRITELIRMEIHRGCGVMVDIPLLTMTKSRIDGLSQTFSKSETA